MKTRITIKDGVVTMDVIGGHGPSCKEATKPYIDSLGVDPSQIRDEDKPEIREVASQSQQIQAGQG
jgi:hypothetical protein